MRERTNTSGVPLLQGHVALITGASRGIGAATARLFARHGAAVGVNYHESPARAQEVVEAIRAEGGRAIAVQASVDNAEQIKVMVQRIEQELGPIDTLVMNAIAGSRSVDPSDKEAMAARSKSVFTPFLESDWESYQNVVIRTLAGIYLPALAKRHETRPPRQRAGRPLPPRLRRGSKALEHTFKNFALCFVSCTERTESDL